jgi:hypothetical protein
MERFDTSRQVLRTTMNVRIYQPAKTAMQSGLAKTRHWLLEYDQTARRELDPLMGWTSSPDTSQQVHLTFDTSEEAVAFAQANGLAYTIEEPAPRKPQPKSYADNFRFDRFLPWTH